jgi:hypothetical protein
MTREEKRVRRVLWVLGDGISEILLELVVWIVGSIVLGL